LFVTGACTVPVLGQDWVEFTNETGTRLVNGSFGGAVNHNTDNQEKDYAHGDVDLDGDIDLVVVRKQPFTSTGRRTNALFINEGISDGRAVNGVLVDRTDEFVTDSSIDNGFLTELNDRDVVLVDLDLDGWLDMVTAVTLSDVTQDWISHPRIYMNKGEIGGVWQGSDRRCSTSTTACSSTRACRTPGSSRTSRRRA
jgi:hypothetical protein